MPVGKVVVVDTSSSPYAKLKPVPITQVELRDSFWAPRISSLLTDTLPHIYAQLNEKGYLDNFRRLVGKVQTNFKGYPFADEHVYKWLEATAWLLSYRPSKELLERVKEVIELIEAVQEPDGYINTRFYGKPKERYKKLDWSHELYVGGHLIQAAIACRRTNVCGRLFNVALKYGKHLIENFGPGRIEIPDGHPEVEMALVELYRETRNKRYIELAEFLIDLRGRGKFNYLPYFVDNKPFKQLDEAPPGAHAVRFLYLVTGATDIYLEKGDRELWDALERLWLDIVRRKMYITGGVGARYAGESIGEAYELPNESAYAETCAAVANVMWNYRMLLATAEAKYADIMELTLYNGALSGISLDGRNFFYTNPLADRGKHRRQPWLHCPCCPPNIARLLASLPGYFYSTSNDGIWIHLYASNNASIYLNNNKVVVSQETMYPWDGYVKIKVKPEKEDVFAIYLRIPGWADQAEILVNGRPLELLPKPSSYVRVEREWRWDDSIELKIGMNIKLVASHPKVIANTGKVAIMRGPLVYCLEQIDNPGIDVWGIGISSESKLEAVYEPNLLKGVVSIVGEGFELTNNEQLYNALNKYVVKARKVLFKAIPYYAWANRDPGPMTVWIPLIDVFKKVRIER